MKNNVANRKAICDYLLEQVKVDKDIIVLCTDSRGSASMAPFFEEFPENSVEIGIAEQNVVSVAAGLAKCKKKALVFSPACFLSTRSYEQAKVDVAYSNTNVKLIGISGGVSYGALGMSHHSAQDIAGLSAIPNMRVYLPSDRFQTVKLMEALLKDEKPAYIRIGRNPVEDVYSEDNCPFELDKAISHGEGKDLLIVACGEMVYPAVKAIDVLKTKGIEATVLDMYCVKPIDKQSLLDKARQSKAVITIEEHSAFGGLGSMVSQAIAEHCPKKVVNISLPDEPVVTGTSADIFAHYGMNEDGIVERAMELFQ